MKGIIFGVIFAALIIPLSSTAYAGVIYDITIPSGSADSNSPFHWSSEKDGDTSGFIEIIVGEVIHWKNADTVGHTVVSGNPQSGPDRIFDSGILGPGDIFVHKFTEKGEFPYYCTLHPWMTGLVSVVSGNSFLPRVASDVGDGKTTFNLEYKFNRLLSSASVDESSKTISFEFQGRGMNDDNTLTLFLPSDLINGISSVSIDGISTEKYTQKSEDELTLLVINDIPPTSKSITITGTTIIPEFADFAIIVLVSSIAMIVLFSRKQSNSIKKIIYN